MGPDPAGRAAEFEQVNGLCLLVCQTFLAEAAAVVAEAGLAQVRVAAFAATCIGPTNDARAIGRLAEQRARTDGDVIVFGSYCLNGLTASHHSAAHAGPVRVVVAPRCLEFAAPAPLVDAQIEAGAYLLTPGWLRRWRHFIAQWGFDQATAREFFAETTQKLVLLDTGVDAQSADHLRACATFLALPCETIPVGLDLLRRRVIGAVSAWRLQRGEDAAAGKAAQTEKQMADSTTAFDLMDGPADAQRRCCR